MAECCALLPKDTREEAVAKTLALMDAVTPGAAEDVPLRERCALWRQREIIASQLGPMAERLLLPPAALAGQLLPALMRLCRDPAAAVRRRAALGAQ